jgi:hypothetical protein
MKCRILCGVIGLLVAGSGLAQAHNCSSYPFPYLPSAGCWNEDVPYFALHPPVYYSHPIYLPYGYPSDYSSQARVVEVKPVVPLIIQNPHMTPKSPTRPTSNSTTQGPQRIINPYVDQPVGHPTDNLTRRTDAALHE